MFFFLLIHNLVNETNIFSYNKRLAELHNFYGNAQLHLGEKNPNRAK